MNCRGCLTPAVQAARYCSQCGARLTEIELAANGSVETDDLPWSGDGFEHVFEQAAVPAAQIDGRTGRFVRLNQAFCDLLQFRLAELLESTVQSVVHADDLGRSGDDNDELSAAISSWANRDIRLLRRDGLSVWGRPTVVPLGEDSESSETYLIFINDVSAQKRAEDVLRRSEARFRAIYESEPECVKLVDRECRLLDMNPAGLKMIQIDSVEAVRGASVFDIIEPNYHAQYRAAVARVFAGERVCHEIEIVGRAGERRWLEEYAVGLHDLTHPGQVTEMLSVSRDITERKRAEQALRESEECCRLLMDAVPAFISYADADQRYRWVNKTYEDWYQRSRDEIVGRTVLEMQGPSNYAQMQQHISKALQGQSVHYEQTLARRTGENRTFDTHYIPHKGGDGRVLGFFVMVFDVTSERAAQQSLRDSEERYRTLIELAPDGIAIFQDRRLVFANSTAARLMRAPSPEALVGMCLDDHMHPDELVASRERHAAILAGRNDIPPHEVRVLRFDGTYLTTETCAGLCLYEGRPAIQVIARDISARKQSEQSLALLNFALKRVGEGVFLIDESARVHYANDQACQALEYSRDELLQMRVSDFDPDFPTPRWPRHWRELAKAGSLLFETRHRTKSGAIYPVEVCANYFEHDGRGWNLGLARNISERKRLERSLRLAQFSIDRAVDSVFWVGSDATILNVNEAACRTLGYLREELIGRTVPEIDPNFSLETWPANWEELRERGSFTFESNTLTKDGRLLHTEVTVNYLLFEGQELNCVVVEDVTDRKRAEDELETLRDQLAHAARVGTMGELASGFAHELNQPLAALHLFADAGIHLGAGVKSEGLRECLSQISEQSLRAGEIIRRMRAFAARAPSTRRPIDLNELLNEVLAIIGFEIRRHGVKVTRRLDGDLPLVNADAIQIQQVLVNLIRNAMDAMSETAEERRELFVGTGTSGGDVRVEIRDNGCGVDPSVMEHLFEPFHTTKPAGLGIGLSISHTLIEAHRGRIACEPNPDGGTTFYFLLPAAELVAAT